MNESSRHGVAIIGLGTVGRRFIEQFDAHPDFALVGGFDVDDRARSAAATDFGITTFDDAVELIHNDGVDLVYIAVPPLFHEQYVDETIRAGSAIFCEKPLGVDHASTEAMVARVDESGLPAAVNFVFGAAPSAVEMVRLVAGGACGTVTGVDLRLHFRRWPRDWQAAAQWLRDRDQGGWVREVASHYVFLIHRLLGPTEITQCHVGYPGDGSSEQSVMAVLSGGDVEVRLTGTSDCAGPDEIEFTVRGTHRSLRLSNWYQLLQANGDGSWEPVLSPQATAPAAAYAAQLGHVGLLIEQAPHTLATFAEAFAVQRTIEALLTEGDR